MSWSVSMKPTKKADVDAAIDALSTNTSDGPMEDQLRVAKLAAKLLAFNVPGPYLYVSMSGHANGVGWQEKSGWSNDCISVSISQTLMPPAA